MAVYQFVEQEPFIQFPEQILVVILCSETLKM